MKVSKSIILILLFNLSFSTHAIDFEVLHLLKEDYQNYCSSSKFTTNASECGAEGMSFHVNNLEKINLINEALLVKREKIKEAMAQNVLMKKCYLNTDSNLAHCDVINDIVEAYISVKKAISTLQKEYLDKCGYGADTSLRHSPESNCQKAFNQQFTILNETIQTMELKNPFLKMLNSRMLNNHNRYFSATKAPSEVLTDSVVRKHIYDSMVDMDELYLEGLEKNNQYISNDIASDIVFESDALSTDQINLLSELSAFYFSDITNPSINPKWQFAKCQLLNRVLQEENRQAISEFKWDVGLTIASLGVGEVFWARILGKMGKPTIVNSIGAMSLSLVSGKIHYDRFKEVDSICEDLSARSAINIEENAALLADIKQCEFNSMATLLDVVGEAVAFSLPLKKILTRGAIASPQGTPSAAVAGDITRDLTPAKSEGAKSITKELFDNFSALKAAPYENIKSGSLVRSIRGFNFTGDGKYLFLKTKDGAYYVVKADASDLDFPEGLKDPKKIIEYLKSSDERFVNTHRSLIRKFDLFPDSVVASGEIKVIDGKIIELNNRSGTFKMPAGTLDNVAEDLGLSSNLVVGVNETKMSRSHLGEEVTTVLRDSLQKEELYQELGQLKLKTAKLLESKNISYESLGKEVQKNLVETFSKVKSKELSPLEIKKADAIKKTFDFLVHNQESELYFVNFLASKNHAGLEEQLNEYKKFIEQFTGN